MANLDDLKKAIDFANKQNENSLQWMEELKKERDFHTKNNPSFINEEKETLRKVVYSYISILIEHHKSIIELINIRQFSALALIRPLYEAHIRVVWLSVFENTSKATKSLRKICELNDNNSFPSLEIMCKEIDEEYSKIQNIENPELMQKNFNNMRKIIHSYAHGGVYLLSIKMNKKDAFTYEDSVDILDGITNYLLHSMSSLAQVEKNVDISLKVYQETQNWY